jgi:hypothetical protein
MYLRRFEVQKNNWVRKSQIPPKIYGSQIANLQNATFAEGPQI